MVVLTRLAAFIIAILLAIDGFSGERTETLRVDGHARIPRWHRVDEYRLQFAGGRVQSCEVGWTVFNALSDGDQVVVDTSRVFRSCDGIRRGDEVINPSSSRKWYLLVPMLILLAAALGWIQFDRRIDDGRRDGGWWFS